MNHLFTRIILSAALVASTAALAFTPNELSSPVGFWKTIDDVSGQAKSVVQISESSDGQLSGRVAKLFRDPELLCTACTGSKQGKPVLGMEIMSNLKHDPKHADEWTGGEILDPKNGKTYHCLIKLSEGGQKMIVRGYFGLPLFGRSQTWIRETT